MRPLTMNSDSSRAFVTNNFQDAVKTRDSVPPLSHSLNPNADLNGAGHSAPPASSQPRRRAC
jgi:hypothetical protein